MDQPKIVSRKPELVELEPGTYYWCACGLSSKQPYCDGAHKSTDWRPVKLEIKEKERVAFCMCRRTANAPFCDGAHGKIDE